MQSGYSAGAMVLATKALLEANPDPTEAEIRDALSGILDRETGYVKVVEAVQRAAAALRGEKSPPDGPGRRRRPSPERRHRQAAPGRRRPTAKSRWRCRVRRASPDVPQTAVVGKPETKVDALTLVKGNPAFTDDVEPRGMLFAKVLRSPHAHARIVAIDDSAARGAARRARRAALPEHRPGEVRLRRAELAQPAAVGPGELRRQGPPRRVTGSPPWRRSRARSPRRPAA